MFCKQRLKGVRGIYEDRNFRSYLSGLAGETNHNCEGVYQVYHRGSVSSFSDQDPFNLAQMSPAPEALPDLSKQDEALFPHSCEHENLSPF